MLYRMADEELENATCPPLADGDSDDDDVPNEAVQRRMRMAEKVLAQRRDAKARQQARLDKMAAADPSPQNQSPERDASNSDPSDADDDDLDEPISLGSSVTLSRPPSAAQIQPSAVVRERAERVYAKFAAAGCMLDGDTVANRLESDGITYSAWQLLIAVREARRRWRSEHPETTSSKERAAHVDNAEWRRRLELLERRFPGVTLPPNSTALGFTTNATALNDDPRWQELKRRFAETLEPPELQPPGTPAFDVTSRSAWDRICHRYNRAKEKERWPRQRRSADVMHRLRYTPLEAYRCDQFDGLAYAWDEKQAQLEEQLRDALKGGRCDCCAEIRPVWISELRLVANQNVRGIKAERPLAWKSPAADAIFNRYANEPRKDIDGTEYVGSFLCSRCRGTPSKAELENEDGMLRFDEENDMHLTDLGEFADAWDAEIALVRMLVPCIRLKVLKHGGVLSKMHSVCLPHKVTLQTSLPLHASEAGLVYYTKDGGNRKHKVRPDKMQRLVKELEAYARGPYRRETDEDGNLNDSLWNDNQAAAVFGGATPWPEVVEIEFPTMQHNEDLEEDTGPSAAQQAGASEEDHETSSGFAGVMPQLDLQRSMDEVLGRQNGGDGGRGNSTSRQPPAFHSVGVSEAQDEFGEYYFTKVFPEIFVDGSADFKLCRQIEVKFDEWLEHLMWTGDQRAARHKSFPFVAFSVLQRRRAMSQGSFFFSSRLGSGGGSDGADAVSLAELNERIKAGDNSLAKAIYFWGGNIVGSDAYNASLNKEIEALVVHMLQQPKPHPPSLFITFSMAEFHWQRMMQYLSLHVLKVEGPGDDGSNSRWAADPTAEAFKTLRFNKLQEYAHVVTLYFEQRVTSYIKEVLTPMFRIVLHYGVMEFAAGRGAIHLHMLVWLEDGEPHRTMHAPVPRGISEGGEAAVQAWREAIDKREEYERQHDPTSNLASADPPPAAPRAVLRDCPPESVTGGGDSPKAKAAREQSWKAYVLERWMREFNFRADHPSSDRADWPAPEGTLPARDFATDGSPLSVLRVATTDPVRHLIDVSNVTSIHRCRRSYCLCELRRGAPSEGYRECAKGGFGPEAPLVHHQVRGTMAPQAGGAPSEQQGLAMRFDSAGGYYVVNVGSDQVALEEEATGRLYICRLDKARPAADAEHAEQCTNRRCSGCAKPPPLGKARRTEPALLEERGVLKIELPRDHPRFVQGMWVVSEHWMANADQSVIMCRRAPEECTSAELAEVTNYFPGYMSKGNKGSSEYAAIWRHMVKDASSDDSLKKLVRQLLIKICGNDFPRQQVLFMLSGGKTAGKQHGALRHTNAMFERFSLTGSRRIRTAADTNPASAQASTKDKYKARDPKHEALSPYNWLRRDSTPTQPRVPLITGNHMWYTHPPSAQYCHNMFQLHTAWRDENTLPTGADAIAAFEDWSKERTEDDPPSVWGACPVYVQAEIGRVKDKDKRSSQYAGDDDEYEYDDVEPDWVDLLGATSSEAEELDNFQADNFTTRDDFDQRRHTRPQDPRHADYLQDAASFQAMNEPARWWKDTLEREKQRAEQSKELSLFAEDPRKANDAQSRALVLLLHSLYMTFASELPALQIARHDELLALRLKARGRRVLLIGRPGGGKSFVLRCCSTLTRMVTGVQQGAIVGAPTGIAAYVAGGLTWHSLLGIPCGSRFKAALSGVTGSIDKQTVLRHVFAVLGDECSMTGRELFAWVAHLFRVNVAGGKGADEPAGGDHLPFWLQAGDFDQLPPVLDLSLLSNASRSANSNYGRSTFTLFEEDVIVLSQSMRQDETQEARLLSTINNMRRGARGSEYDFEFVKEKSFNRLSQPQRAKYSLPKQGTLCCYYTWEKAWKRNKTMLNILNAGYALPSRELVEGVPVYKLLSTNEGRHARAKAADMFQGVPASTWVARGAQIRLTCNMYGALGQKWGLVNGAIGQAVEVLYPTPEAAAKPTEIPLVIAHFEGYTGPAFCEKRPKLVLLVPVERTGDCSCRCRRRGPCFRMSEGTTIHATQGITVGPKHQVKQIGIEFGDRSFEQKARGGSLVAQSRPQTEDNFCYLSPVSRDRLGAIGTDQRSAEIRAQTERYEQNQSPDAARLVAEGFFTPLLEWAVAFAKAKHGIVALWLQAEAAVALQAAWRGFAARHCVCALRDGLGGAALPPVPPPAPRVDQCFECDDDGGESTPMEQ